MKRFLLMLAVCLLFCSTAQANQWGLRGELLQTVMQNDDYDAYAAQTEAETKTLDAAVLQSRYHSLMMAAVKEGGSWRYLGGYTKAVYQPEDERAASAKLEATKEGFALLYEDERYDFAVFGGSGTEYVLRKAQIGDFTLTLNVTEKAYAMATRPWTPPARPGGPWGSRRWTGLTSACFLARWRRLSA